MSNLPLVSVIMPVHNGEKYLEQSLQSALDQDYSNTEVIVVDDGSTDQTPEILRAFGNRIISIRQANSGAAAARNAALRVARGEFVAFLDADDFWLPHKLRLQVSHLLANPAIDLVASRWRVVGDEANRSSLTDTTSTEVSPCQLEPTTSGWLYHALLVDCVIHTTTVMLRRQLVDKVGMFDPTLRRGQDYDYWLRASRVTQIHTLDAELSCYRLHATNSTWQPQPVNYGAMVIERALRQWGRTGPDGHTVPLRTARRRVSDLWSSFGHQHATNGSLATARSAALHAVIAYPLAAKPWRLMIACIVAPLRRH